MLEAQHVINVISNQRQRRKGLINSFSRLLVLMLIVLASSLIFLPISEILAGDQCVGLSAFGFVLIGSVIPLIWAGVFVKECLKRYDGTSAA